MIFLIGIAIIIIGVIGIILSSIATYNAESLEVAELNALTIMLYIVAVIIGIVLMVI